jgi:hypothetical protein
MQGPDDNPGVNTLLLRKVFQIVAERGRIGTLTTPEERLEQVMRECVSTNVPSRAVPCRAVPCCTLSLSHLFPFGATT